MDNKGEMLKGIVDLLNRLKIVKTTERVLTCNNKIRR